jgi:hypothetical protein
MKGSPSVEICPDRSWEEKSRQGYDLPVDGCPVVLHTRLVGCLHCTWNGYSKTAVTIAIGLVLISDKRNKLCAFSCVLSCFVR